VQSRVPTADIEALLGYLPARCTHSSLGVPTRPTTAVARSQQSRQGQVQSLQSALRGAKAEPLWPQPQAWRQPGVHYGFSGRTPRGACQLACGLARPFGILGRSEPWPGSCSSSSRNRPQVSAAAVGLAAGASATGAADPRSARGPHARAAGADCRAAVGLRATSRLSPVARSRATQYILTLRRIS
jgi:hypothetical protein